MTRPGQPPGASPGRPCVLVLAGVDPSGGAGVFADVQAIAAMGAHALPVVTVLTVQDNNRVYAIYPVPPDQVQAQAAALMAAVPVAAVKIGIVGSRANADCIAALLAQMTALYPALPVILDPVLASGHGDILSQEDAVMVLAPLIAHATLITPNLPEAVALCGGLTDPAAQAHALLAQGARHVLIKGGHGAGSVVTNDWYAADGTTRSWRWPRLDGAFHGSGCTLASAIAGLLAGGASMADALAQGQAYCHQTLVQAFAIGSGQLVPERTLTFLKEPA